MSGSSPQFRAGADIKVSRFVTLSADDTVIQSVAGDLPIGIMHESSWATPIPGADGDTAVIAGESKRVYGEDEVCMLKIAATGIAVGDKIKPDADGAGVVAAAGEAFGAIALQGCAGEALVKCVVRTQAAAA